MDESGDLGFDYNKIKTTKKFVITSLVCYSNTARSEFKKAVRRTLKNKLNSKTKKSRYITELKGTNTRVEVKVYLLRNIKNNDWNIYTLVLNKIRVEPHLRTKIGKKKLYNFLSRVLLEKLPIHRIERNVELIVDRCKNKEEVKDFNQYLINQLEALLPLNTALNISHLASVESAELQAVDLFSWGIFRKYEYNNMEWYNKFMHKITYETEYVRD